MVAIANIIRIPQIHEARIVEGIDNPESMQAKPLHPKLVKNPIKFLKLMS